MTAVDSMLAAPECPECGADMVLRKGKFGDFWGCSQYAAKQCQGSMNLDKTSKCFEEPDSEKEPTPPLRVRWRDATTTRDGWRIRHASAGGSLRSRPNPAARAYEICWVAVEDREATDGSETWSTPEATAAIWSMLRLLARGAAPPMHPDDEERLINNTRGLAPEGRDWLVLNAGDTEWDCDVQMFDSDEEEQFVRLVEESQPGAARWLLPQAPLDTLAWALGFDKADPEGKRRLDFLFCPPCSDPIVVEIDGLQHKAAKAVDAVRDKLLKEVGIPVFRVPTEQVRGGSGENLDDVLRVISEVQYGPTTKWHRLVWGPIQAHRLMLAICVSAAKGWLASDHWEIEIEDPSHTAAQYVGGSLGTLAALAAIWGAEDSMPKRVIFRDAQGNSIQGWRQNPSDSYSFEPIRGQVAALNRSADVRILLQSDRSPIERLPEPGNGPPTIVVRSTGVPAPPVDLPRPDHAPFRPPDVDPERSCAPLEAVMRAVFGNERRQFRDGQLAAISAMLAGRDCAVLLPTGAGKSMTYQLPTLVLPGRALVIDPINALIADQMEGLAAHGIDRVNGITFDNPLVDAAAANAYYVFVSPERTQREDFRDHLTAQAATRPISIAAVDESHCVSEWGHDFRPAYLNIGRTLRNVCSAEGQQPPPILALTGTASRAVLRDMLFQLDIPDDPDHVVSPGDFDRPEISYKVVLTNPARSSDRLIEVLEEYIPGELIPDPLNRDSEQVYRPCGLSGIVFIRTVNGTHRSLDDTLTTVTRVIPTAGGFSTTMPNGRPCQVCWDGERFANARNFKKDRISAIVATKAFGMGIDKANIRWVVHYGLPSSIESFYQEVGRAGRDGQPAASVLVVAEQNRAGNRQRLLANELNRGGPPDDVSTVIFFHMNSFPGFGREARTAIEVYLDLCNSNSIPLSEARERALHRLSILGLVDDYTIRGFGPFERATVSMADLAPTEIADRLVDFVARSAPGRAEGMRNDIDQLSPLADTETAVRECSRLLARFVHETVEGSRRQSLLGMWELTEEEDSEGVRERILEYLSEGIASAEAQRLAEQSHFIWEDWAAKLESIEDTAGAREWRAATTRLLGSYPDHPGLLAARTLAGTLAGDHPGDTEIGMAQAFRNAVSLYQTSLEDADQMAVRAIDFLRHCLPFADSPEHVSQRHAAAIATAAITELGDSPLIEEWLAEHWMKSPDIAAVKLTSTLRNANRIAQQVIEYAQPQTERTP